MAELTIPKTQGTLVPMALNKAKNNRDKLLQEAIWQMAEKGYLGFTIDAVLEHTGIAKSNAYYHFPTKEALGVAVLDYWASINQILIDRTLANSNLMLDQRLAQYIGRLVMFQEQGGYVGDCLTCIASQLNLDQSRHIFIAAEAKLHQALTDYIAEGQKQRMFREDINSTATASLIIALLRGAHFSVQILHTAAPLHKVSVLIHSLLAITAV